MKLAWTNKEGIKVIREQGGKNRQIGREKGGEERNYSACHALEVIYM
jgi:hypothetical protein